MESAGNFSFLHSISNIYISYRNTLSIGGFTFCNQFEYFVKRMIKLKIVSEVKSAPRNYPQTMCHATWAPWSFYSKSRIWNFQNGHQLPWFRTKLLGGFLQFLSIWMTIAPAYIVIWTLRNSIQRKANWNWRCLFQEDAFESFICKMATILYCLIILILSQHNCRVLPSTPLISLNKD